VLPIVNTANQCGFTLQFDPLEGLQGTYKAEGLAAPGSRRAIQGAGIQDEQKTHPFCARPAGDIE
jgi:glutathione peroxidase-family protein